jgi:hypothetical protein
MSATAGTKSTMTCIFCNSEVEIADWLQHQRKKHPTLEVSKSWADAIKSASLTLRRWFDGRARAGVWRAAGRWRELIAYREIAHFDRLKAGVSMQAGTTAKRF